MDEKSMQVPLLSSKETTANYSKRNPLLISSAKWVLKAAIWAIFVFWVASILLLHTHLGSKLMLKMIDLSEKDFSLAAGIMFLIYTAPLLLITFLATPYIALRGEHPVPPPKSSWRYPQFRLWTLPVLVDGPFGVVSAAELIGILLFVIYVIYALSVSTINNISIVHRDNFHDPSSKIGHFLGLTGLHLGKIGIVCLCFLFLPIARGSILFRLLDIPFEHATRYHVWLGHLTMALFTLHGLFFVIEWVLEGRLIQQLTEWKGDGIAHLPGVISLVSGLLMWVMALPGVRRANFELFFYTHQLYIVFVIGLMLHVSEFIFCLCAGAIFLFLLDRFLRFCQSRRTVDVLSARSFPCGTLELVLSKPANLHYNALSWVFLQVRELSWLQWHPFSVSSTPLSGDNHLALLIKVSGDWTGRLERQILQPPVKMTASVEGPYGHESPYFLEYENLIFVAGGIGISPFCAILSDLLHQIKDGKPCLPKNVLIVWAIKKSDELTLLQTVGLESIYPAFSTTFNLEIQTYVTRELGPSLEEGSVVIDPVNAAHFPTSNRRGMSVLVGTGSILWSGSYIIASTIGWIITRALLDVWYIRPYKLHIWWYLGLLQIGCMIVGVVIFGGLLIVAWHLWGENNSNQEGGGTAKMESMQGHEPMTHRDSNIKQYVSTIRFGQRPDLGVIFKSMSDRWGIVDIGVLVCGPPTLQTSVAKECRTQNLRAHGNGAVFHFNSHSFEL